MEGSWFCVGGGERPKSDYREGGRMSARGCIYSRPSFETIDSGERVEEYPAALRRAPRPSASYAQGRSDQRTFYGSPACGASARTVGAQMRSKVPDWVLR